MADVTRQARRRGKEASDEATSQVEDARDATDVDRDEDGGSDDSRSGGQATITGELKETIREAAIEVLKPVMRKATTSAAKYAVTQGPTLVKDKVAPKIQDAGGAGALAKGVASKGGGLAESVGGVASGLGGTLGKLGGKKKEGKSPSGTGRGRRLPVQEYVDVGVDLQTAYDQFTQFEDWPKFMHRVERIEQRDDTTLMWHENIWGVRRSWEAEITEQTPCERIVWRSTGGPQTIGVVTFHRLSDNLTRVAITMDFQPKGLFEKTSSGMRITRRALKSDLMRFKAFIELRDEATGSWEGRIEEGEVVDEQDGGEEESVDTDAQAEQEEDEEQVDEDEESEDEEEPVASEEEDEDEEEPAASEEEDEDEEEPAASEDEDEDEYEDEEEDEDLEPAASEDEEDEPEAEADGSGNGRVEDEEEEPEEQPRPRRRRKPSATAGRRRR
jgi:uncharacterized membrane protein